MKQSRIRVSRQATVGLTITDTAMQYVVLAPHARASNVVGTWGVQTIPYDAIQQGEIVEFAQAAKVARKLHEKTGVMRVCFTTLGDDVLDARWREVFEVGGFGEVITLPRAQALDVLTRDTSGSSVPLLYYSAPDDVVLMHKGIEHESYPYPLEIYAINSIREYLDEHAEDDVYRVLGNFDGSDQEIVEELEDYYIAAQPARIWRNVCNLDQYIPPILHAESFAYALPIANAYTMLQGAYTEADIPKLAHTTFRQDNVESSISDDTKANTQAHSSTAFGRWFEKTDAPVDIQPKEDRGTSLEDIETQAQAVEEGKHPAQPDTADSAK